MYKKNSKAIFPLHSINIFIELSYLILPLHFDWLKKLNNIDSKVKGLTMTEEKSIKKEGLEPMSVWLITNGRMFVGT